MLNLRQLTTDTIEFEDFVSTTQPYVGEHYELPLNAFGSSTARFVVTETRVEGCKIIAKACKVS